MKKKTLLHYELIWNICIHKVKYCMILKHIIDAKLFSFSRLVN